MPLARKPVELTTIESRTLDAGGEVVRRTRVSVWRCKTPAIVSSLPATDRAALADSAYCVAHVGASSGSLDPSGGGGSRPTPKGPSLSRIAAAQLIGRVHAALEPRVVKVDRGLKFRRLIQLVAIEEISPTAIVRELDFTPKEGHSRPAFAAVKAAIHEASALVVAALGHRSDIRFEK